VGLQVGLDIFHDSGHRRRVTGNVGMQRFPHDRPGREKPAPAEEKAADYEKIDDENAVGTADLFTLDEADQRFEQKRGDECQQKRQQNIGRGGVNEIDDGRRRGKQGEAGGDCRCQQQVGEQELGSGQGVAVGHG